MGARQDFEVALQNLKTELIQDLQKANVLKKEVLEALRLEYNQKIINVQVQFLQRLSSTNPSVRIEITEPSATDFSDVGKILMTGLGVGGGAAAALTFITFSVPQVATTWLFWTTTTTTTVTLAAWIASTLGISATLATSILSGGLALIAVGCAYVLFFPTWKKRIRKQMIDDFDSKIFPVLRDWADSVINKYNGME